MNLDKHVRSVTAFCAMALFISLCVPGSGAAEDKPAPFSGNIKFEKYYSDYDVNADGTYTLVREVRIAVLTEQGIKAANHTGFSYSTSLDELQILSACTLKKDGRRIDVPAENIQEREAVAEGGPMFSDIKTKFIIFPDVTVGDSVAFSFKLSRKTALFPGHFSFAAAYNKFVIYDDARDSVRVPLNSLDLRVFASGVEGGRVADENGHARWVWTLKNHEIVLPELGAVDPLDHGPSIVVSSFRDYGAIAAAYEERARPKAAVTDKIRTLAAELTAGVEDRREKAKILYTWVAQNIRYAGNYMGIGSVVPHDVDLVLANRLGDCKDHTALFQALLAAVGIESTPVMINSGDSFKLPEVPALRPLNHVITYIPSLDLYTDPTSEFTPFGLLPIGVCGKPAIHTANFTGLSRTPAVSHNANQSSMKMVLKIHEDGSADGETNNRETGALSTGVRALMTQIRPNVEDRLVRAVLEKSGYTGTGTLVKDDPKKMADSYAYGLKFHLANAINAPGPGALTIHSVFPGGHPLAEVISGLNMPERTLDFGCMGDVVSEEYTIEFPKSINIVAIPKDVHLSQGPARYDATYSREGNTITVVRRFEDRTEGPVCPPQVDNEFRPMARGILKDLKSQLIYQPAEG